MEALLAGTKFMVVTDNMANTYFKNQKNLSPKQSCWQELLAEFEFEWIHQPGRDNAIADALRQKQVDWYVNVMNNIVIDFRDKIKWQSLNDHVYTSLVTQVRKEKVRRYWLEDELLFAKGGGAYVSSGGGLRQQLLKETHDVPWAGHPEFERMRALLSCSFYWPKMMNDIKA